jgi:putative Holliday junction resolvase
MAVDDGVVVVVVGLPLSLDGSRGRAAMAAVEEAAVLRGLLEPRGIEVELFDERLTTVTAHQALAAGGADERGRRQIVDQAAAAVMLSAWLESSGARR